MGVFSEWQPRYAELGISTFPVEGKRPCIKGYLNLGLPASVKLVAKFPNAQAIGLVCQRNGFTIIDVDSTDEAMLRYALEKYGPTPFIVRTGSRHFQCWYKHSGEARAIRPDSSVPIDILGGGFVVAPPSHGVIQQYEIIEGSLDDLHRLPPMRRVEPDDTSDELSSGHRLSSEDIEVGGRNVYLFSQCLRRAVGCRDLSELLRFAGEVNRSALVEPLSEGEVRRTAESAWKLELRGENWAGQGGKVVISHSEIDDLVGSNPDALTVLAMARRHHWGRHFVLANATAGKISKNGWAEKRFAKARRALIERQLIEEIRPASRQSGPALFRFKGSRN